MRILKYNSRLMLISTAERSQFLNKKDALTKLNAILEQMQDAENAKQINSAWREHTQIVRGNPVRVYEGIEFRRKIQNEFTV